MTRLLLAFLLACFAAAPLRSDPAPGLSLKLPAIISDHMVLQAGKKDALWGWAAAGVQVKIEWCDATGHALATTNSTADSSGKWKAELAPLTAGVAGEIHVAAGAETLTVKDVLVGENWLCGGQSNMAFVMARVLNAKTEMVQANDPQLRLFLVAHQLGLAPQDDVHGKWELCTPDSVTHFSAVGYYFGRRLRSELNEPVGLIGTYAGGTGAQVWISLPALQGEPGLRTYVSNYQQTNATYPHGDATYQALAAVARGAQVKWTQDVAKDAAYQSALAAWTEASAKAKEANQPAPVKPQPPIPFPAGPTLGAKTPTIFYNGMVAPLAPFTVKGVIWFQADGNLGEVSSYGLLIKTLIKDWRTQWADEFPFYYVEMNNMRDYPQKNPVQEGDLSLLREAQQAALELPKTGVVCSIDVGLPVPEPHFPNKKPVGDRLANLALNDLYNHPGLVHSPEYKAFKVEGNKIRLQFNYADGLRVTNGGALKGFAIRTAGGTWMWADGKIDHEDIVVWNDQIPQPADVRYAWASNPIISVENSAGLPMRPFRTDTQSAK